MVKNNNKIDREYAYEICYKTKEIIEDRMNFPINFIIMGGIISKGYSYNDIDTIIIPEIPITDEESSLIALLLYENIPEVSHHTILYLIRDHHQISYNMGMKPELMILATDEVNESIRREGNGIIRRYKSLYEDLSYNDPILCLKENIEVVTPKDYKFL